ncbi:hypothetical protein CERZMDRAFT_94915 [Cercospora zeae-maydis SCOH1-5]|uniref:Uncharacterized protein n=1 Tax=Cercospora zeae-maydis SCOH1-5 TaxID=717836 RepID=A0A6A6FQE4_9PEZI|nr:hypothetical protein CERZMDRAFT_94915 [Cercospora zeae-maydis SCOH1-5]
MPPQDFIATIANTPQQIAQDVASVQGDAAFASGKVTIAILVHNEDNDILLPNGFILSASPSLAIQHFPTHFVDLQPFAADDDADISVQSLAEDAITNMLGPIEVQNLGVLCHVGIASASKGAEVFIFTACRIDSSHIPDAFLDIKQWLAEADSHEIDLRAMVSLLGADNVADLLRACEAWKEKQCSSLDSIPDLVAHLPSKSSPTAAEKGSTLLDGGTESCEDSGYQPDSESSADSDSTWAPIDNAHAEPHVVTEDLLDDDIPELVEGVVFGNEPSSNKATLRFESMQLKQSQPRQTSRVFGAQVSDEDDTDENKDQSKPLGRRTFQPDPAVTRGCRQSRKQQKNPPLMVDPTYHWNGPRFVRPAQKVEGRRFRAKFSKTAISMATDKAVTKDRLMWEDLPRIGGENRLVRQ